MPLDVLQGLVEGGSAHPKMSCDFRFALPISDHLASEFCLLWCEGWVASFVLPCGFGNSNSFSLPFPNHGSFKLGDCADDLELELLKGGFRFACGKGESFLYLGTYWTKRTAAFRSRGYLQRQKPHTGTDIPSRQKVA